MYDGLSLGFMGRNIFNAAGPLVTDEGCCEHAAHRSIRYYLYGKNPTDSIAVAVVAL